MLESVFLKRLFDVSDSLGERTRVFSVGNVELIQNWFTLGMQSPSGEFIDPRVKFGKQECEPLF